MTDFLAWANEIERMAADARRTPECQAERDWYRTYTRFDIEQILATLEGRVGFHAGMLYARCQRDCGTAVEADVPTRESVNRGEHTINQYRAHHGLAPLSETKAGEEWLT